MMMAGAQTRPYLTVVVWQIAATAVAVAASAWFSGFFGALSAALGGAVALAGSFAYLLLIPRRTRATPWDTLGSLLKAEGVKVGVMVLLLWLVMAVFKKVVAIWFIGTFTVAVLIFSMAIFVRNPVALEMDKNNVD